MDFLRYFTKNWKLRTSFIAYLLVSLIISIPFAFFIHYIAAESRKEFILSNILSENSRLINKFMLSNFLGKLIDFIPIIIIILFLYIFFNLFYEHKIKSVIDFLENFEEMDLEDRNELTRKSFDLIKENENLKQTNLINIRNMNNLYKQMDTILHELKNPLAVLSGDIEMLTGIYNYDDEKINIIIARITRSVDRIKSYINKLRVREGLNSLELKIKDISFDDFINFIQKDLTICHKNIDFSYKLRDLSKKIMLDLELFLEGFTNIIKNSDAYAKSKISINIYEDEEFLIVEIEDDGLGFSKDALNNYNKPYFSENPLVCNMGLGLYITDEIMKKQDIKMFLSNNSGANTKLFIKKL